MATPYRLKALTPRERQVLTCVWESMTNRDIAEHLKISVDTVSHHMRNLFDKTGSSNRLELAMMTVHGRDAGFDCLRAYVCAACTRGVVLREVTDRPGGFKVKLAQEEDLAYDLRQVCPSCVELLHDAIGAALARCKLKLPEAAQTT